MNAAARSGRSRFWFDPRFSIGIGLVITAIIGVVAIVANADATTPVLAAREPLMVGDTISRSDLVAVQVRLGTASDRYLIPDALPADGLVVTRTVAAGELVPMTAVGTQSGITLTNIVVRLQGSLPASIGPGSVVDVWASRAGENGQFGPPAVLVDGAEIVRLVASSGFMTDDGTSVEILVPKHDVAALLEAMANGSAIAAVPVNTPVER
ncbi:flagellar protein FlgA [Leifsonia kafniensis]|uniref:Flagellar protein FlgA n=1 Tax=Leifsonia kafniensis TaxID=475957 RepID=A0ABP7L3X4_9MICO